MHSLQKKTYIVQSKNHSGRKIPDRNKMTNFFCLQDLPVSTFKICLCHNLTEWNLSVVRKEELGRYDIVLNWNKIWFLKVLV